MFFKKGFKRLLICLFIMIFLSVELSLFLSGKKIEEMDKETERHNEILKELKEIKKVLKDGC